MTVTFSIGIAGIGIMGFHMARRLAEAGHTVRAWNRTREKAERLEPTGVSVVDDAAETALGEVDIQRLQPGFGRLSLCAEGLFAQAGLVEYVPRYCAGGGRRTGG